jgi:hypothetical protein
MEKQPELHERILMVLEFGHGEQVKDVLLKIPGLEEGAQKTLIPNLSEVPASKDPAILIAYARMIGDVKWNDLDDTLVPLLENAEEPLLFAILGAAKKKRITAIVPKAIEYIQKANFIEPDNGLIEYMNVVSYFGNNELESFFVEKLKSSLTNATYRNNILGVLASMNKASDDSKSYILDIFHDENESIGLRARAVSALGKLNYTEASEEFRNKLKEIDTWLDVDKKIKHSQLRTALLSALVRMGDKDIGELLIRMSRDDDEKVRAEAVRQMGELKDSKFKKVLEYKSKYDTSVAVQADAKKSLELINEK